VGIFSDGPGCKAEFRLVEIYKAFKLLALGSSSFYLSVNPKGLFANAHIPSKEQRPLLSQRPFQSVKPEGVDPSCKWSQT